VTDVTEEERISLKEHFERRISEVNQKLEDWVRLWREERARGLVEIERRAIELEKRLIEKAEAQERAVDKAEKAMNERLTGMNEFRDTLRDQASKFTTRTEMDVEIDSLKKALRDLELFKSNLEGRLLIMGSVFAVVIIVLNVLIRYAGF
jgi:hypothetical protein